MRKEAIFLLVLCIILILPLTNADDESIEDMASACIQDQIDSDTCESIGLEDKIFALLSVNECKTEILDDVSNGECWGVNGCNVKTTSQAIIALDESRADTTDYETWLLNQKIPSTGLEGLVQIETFGVSTCNIKDVNNNAYQVAINADKTLSLSGSNTCLTLDSTGYWLRLNPSCQDQEFEVSCSESFIVSSLFKDPASLEIFLLDEDPVSSSGGGTTIFQPSEALCFKRGNSCNYEATLWATSTLKKLGHDVSAYLPYLVAFENDFESLLPESFLYHLTGEDSFLSELRLKQKSSSYWDEAGNKYYDTALALLPTFGVSFEEKDNAISWLEENQGNDGCWNSGSIEDTGFLLYSIWPNTLPPGPDIGETDICEIIEGYCVNSFDCTEAGGSEITALTASCYGYSDVCCTVPEVEQTCFDLAGFICEEGYVCPSGLEEYGSSDFGTCCAVECEIDVIIHPNPDTCTPNEGTCSSFCGDDEKTEYGYSCPDSSDYCCLLQDDEDGPSKLGIWILIALIVIVGIAIFFRQKLNDMFKKKPKMKGRPGMPPSRPGMPPRRGMTPHPRRMPQRSPPRRIIPRTSQAPQRRAPTPKKSGEIDDVLKKLKDIGK